METERSFYFEMPPYLEIDFDRYKDEIYRFFTKPSIVDVYCVDCKKESVFHAKDSTVSHHQYLSNLVYYDGIIMVCYHCTRNSEHLCHFIFHKQDNCLVKIGQFPSVADFQIPDVKKYRKILSAQQYNEFVRGIGLVAHGIGVGSFVYLRRIFESLIEEAHEQIKINDGDFLDEEYLVKRMDEKIEMLSEILPEFLVKNRGLYSILSKGIHELTEEECLKYFEAVKIGIEQILDEKIIQKEREEKASRAHSAIQRVQEGLSKE